ncbi:MAG: LemA family protein [Candidatus Nanoarchaeia archaeon]|nr:LemA family protein [Candidatus Nanoarchaeia archaeon]
MLAIFVLVIILGVSFVGGGIGIYNSLKTSNNTVDQAAADIDTVTQRRMDLIPNLVGATKGVMKFEKDVFVEVTEARSKAGQANISFKDLQNVTPEQMQQFQAAQQGLSGAISRLLVVMEKYPDLKSHTQVTQLMDELAGTENRIAVARKRYNETVKALNDQIVVFPNNIIAGWFNIQKRTMFQADEAAKTAPKVDLSLDK